MGSRKEELTAVYGTPTSEKKLRGQANTAFLKYAAIDAGFLFIDDKLVFMAFQPKD